MLYSDINKKHMNKETLEEAMIKDGYWESDYDKIWREGVQFGAKWQEERMYSEEEVQNILIEYVKTNPTKPYRVVKWFEQFKKK
jgi:hypothetical protein